ncbi:hypothetical protein HS088_TW15G00294 [Tripterygium wilfordii]|uniref:Uncharacterized protein n=1 Tax=Tripterygium wilfordii TaxID=458696 RepID=A0A7J7CLA4_TRIWF|nr:hypothetical protein HS088_TW15G00294 [Tripterygium wilfordii]
MCGLLCYLLKNHAYTTGPPVKSHDLVHVLSFLGMITNALSRSMRLSDSANCLPSQTQPPPQGRKSNAPKAGEVAHTWLLSMIFIICESLLPIILPFEFIFD